ncbi:hypothetical protein E2C01_024811 [Portunus trituberculatus]|uniref:Transposable element Tc1 transposase n=1 Tax=Portunus trituberculatus TaxID=210409 RepID=A0A5B7EDE3_PORTR|nr:hypothetical protein [Portunus trituberculatus]
MAKRPFLLLARQLRLATSTLHSLLWVMHSFLQDKTRAFALLVEGWSVILVAVELKVTRRTIYKLKTAAENLRLGEVPARKPGSGAPRMMSPCTGKKRRLDFWQKYKEWTLADWQKIMFSDESTFWLVRGGSKVVRRPSNASRYNPCYHGTITRDR